MDMDIDITRTDIIVRIGIIAGRIIIGRHIPGLIIILLDLNTTGLEIVLRATTPLGRTHIVDSGGPHNSLIIKTL